VVDREIDRATILGIIAAFGLLAVAIAAGQGASVFIDLRSLLIVLGGTFGATLINFPLEDLVRAGALTRRAFFPETRSVELRVHKILSLAELVRQGGPVALQSELVREYDPFFRKSMELVADALPPEDIRRILEIEVNFLVDRHRRGAQLFTTMGNIAPAMGLLGTVIGLIQMLRNLEDPSAIGPGMAVALVTTFYGSVLSNLVFLPIAGKLRTRSEEETLLREMTLEGMVNIAKGMNPRILEECLQSFLAPERRVSMLR
jgi:chemotaxis protein MotA